MSFDYVGLNIVIVWSCWPFVLDKAALLSFSHSKFYCFSRIPKLWRHPLSVNWIWSLPTIPDPLYFSSYLSSPFFFEDFIFPAISRFWAPFFFLLFLCLLVLWFLFCLIIVSSLSHHCLIIVIVWFRAQYLSRRFSLFDLPLQWLAIYDIDFIRVHNYLSIQVIICHHHSNASWIIFFSYALLRNTRAILLTLWWSPFCLIWGHSQL